MIEPGHRFGKLKFIEIIKADHHGRPIALCECSCGNHAQFPLSCLRTGDIVSCGNCKKSSNRKNNSKNACVNPSHKKHTTDLTGQTFGMLTVIGALPKQGKYSYWECKCSCGKTKAVNQHGLLYGNTKSCGCLRGKTCKTKRKNPGKNCKYIGVYKNASNKWVSRLHHKKEVYYFGAFDDQESAVTARNSFIIKMGWEEFHPVQKLKVSP